MYWNVLRSDLLDFSELERADNMESDDVDERRDKLLNHKVFVLRKCCMGQFTTRHLLVHFLSAICLFYGSNAYLPAAQINALFDFYYSTNGKNWHNCEWNVTQLNASVVPAYGICGVAVACVAWTDHCTLQTVTSIGGFWDNINLNGTIPDLIFTDLPDLAGFYIKNEALLQGPIPSGICQANLTDLSLINTSLSGSIPSCLGNMDLQSIDIENNPHLSGAFPAIHSRNMASIRLFQNALI